MAVLTPTTKAQVGPYAVTVNTLTASDSFVYTTGANQHLVLNNTTAAVVNVTLKGNTATNFAVGGYGTVDVSAGKVVAVPANSSVSIVLDSISKFLTGTSTAVTGGTGVTAHLFN